MCVFQPVDKPVKIYQKKPQKCVWKGDKQKAEKDISITEALKVSDKSVKDFIFIKEKPTECLICHKTQTKINVC